MLIENRIPGVPTMLQQGVDMDRSADGCRGKKGRRAGEALIVLCMTRASLKEGVRRLDGFSTTVAALYRRAPAVPYCPSGHSIDRLFWQRYQGKAATYWVGVKRHVKDVGAQDDAVRYFGEGSKFINFSLPDC